MQYENKNGKEENSENETRKEVIKSNFTIFLEIHAPGNYFDWARQCDLTHKFQLVCYATPRRLLLESNERMCKQMGRGNNTKIQWPIICFYITRHFALTFDSYASNISLFFCVSFEMNEFSFGPGRDRIHLSKSIRATRSGQNGNLSYSGA